MVAAHLAAGVAAWCMALHHGTMATWQYGRLEDKRKQGLHFLGMAWYGMAGLEDKNLLWFSRKKLESINIYLLYWLCSLVRKCCISIQIKKGQYRFVNLLVLNTQVNVSNLVSIQIMIHTNALLFYPWRKRMQGYYCNLCCQFRKRAVQNM